MYALLSQAFKSLVLATLLIGVVPLLLGLLFELVVVAPLRVPLDQSPVFFPWQVRFCQKELLLSITSLN